MTYEEAKERLLKTQMPDNEEQREFDSLCLLAIEKRIPKKQTWLIINAVKKYGPYCPECDQEIGQENLFCPNCGQKICEGDEE